MPVSLQMATIRRLRAELSNLFTPSVDSVNKCANFNSPSNKKTNRYMISPPLDRYSGKVGQNRGKAGKTALTRRKSCPNGHHSNIAISRPEHKVRVILFHPKILLRDFAESYI